MGRLGRHLDQIAVTLQALLAAAVADVQDAPLGPSRVIDEADPFPVPQPPQPPGDDSNAVVQQLTVERIVDVGLDRRGIDPNPLAFFQTPSLRPAHQVRR